MAKKKTQALSLLSSPKTEDNVEHIQNYTEAYGSENPTCKNQLVNDRVGLFQPGNPGGVKQYKDPQKLADAIEAYFAQRDEQKLPYTVAGLAYHLGFNSRQSLLNYQKAAGYEGFHIVLERARLKMEDQIETHLLTKQNVIGSIFIMKNSYGYDSPEDDAKNIRIIKVITTN